MRLLDTPEAVGEVVNVGGMEEISIVDLAHRIRKKVGSGADPQLVPYDQVFPEYFEDMQRRVPSTAKLRLLTGFAPRIGLDQILDDVIAHHRVATGAVDTRAMAGRRVQHIDTILFSGEARSGPVLTQPSIGTEELPQSLKEA